MVLNILRHPKIEEGCHKFRAGSIGFLPYFVFICIAQALMVNNLKKIHLQGVSPVSMLVFAASLKDLPGVTTLMRLTRMS